MTFHKNYSNTLFILSAVQQFVEIPKMYIYNSFWPTYTCIFLNARFN